MNDRPTGFGFSNRKYAHPTAPVAFRLPIDIRNRVLLQSERTGRPASEIYVAIMAAGVDAVCTAEAGPETGLFD